MSVVPAASHTRNGLYDTGRVAEAACWAHVRRKFHDIHAAGRSLIAQETLTASPPCTPLRRRSPASHPTCAAMPATPKQPLAGWPALLVGNDLIKAPGRSDVAGAIHYALPRWTALTRYVDDGTIAIDDNPVERAIRPVTKMRSLYPSFSSACEDWKFVLVSTATRACSSPDGVPDLAGLQVESPDLVGCAGHDLLGWQQLVLNQPADDVRSDTQRSDGFAHGQPLAVLLCGAIGMDVMNSPKRADALGRPRLALAGLQSHAVERGCYMLVVPTSGHAPHHRQSAVRGLAPVLARPGFLTRSCECWPPFQWITRRTSRAASSTSATMSTIRVRRCRARMLVAGAAQAWDRSAEKPERFGAGVAGSGARPASRPPS